MLFKYDKDRRILTIKQVEDFPIEIDVFRAHQESYRKFKDVTIHDLINKFCIAMCESLGLKEIVPEIEIVEFNTADKYELLKDSNRFYSVKVAFIVDGFKLNPVEFTRIPYLDKYCVFNFDRSRKSIWCELTNLESIAYDEKNNKVVVNFPNNSFSIVPGSVVNGLDLKIYAKKIPYLYVLRTMCQRDGINVRLEDIFSNKMLSASVADTDDSLKQETIDIALEETRIMKYLDSEDFKLGRLREPLDKVLVIDGCEGGILNRPVKLRSGEVIPRGVEVSSELLQIFKKNLINEVWIRKEPSVAGKEFTGKIIKTLPEGVRLTPLVGQILEEAGIDTSLMLFDGGSRLQKKIEFDNINDMYIINDKTQLTDDIIKLLYDMGDDYIECYSTKDTTVKYKMEQEFIGNYTAKLSDFMEPEDYPEGCTGQERTYYYGISNPYKIKEITTVDTLTAHDMMAIISYTARVQTYPEYNEVVDRERDLVKKVNTYNEIFTQAFKQVMYSYIENYKPHIAKFLKSGETGIEVKVNPFISFYSKWKQAISDRKLLRPSNDLPVISLLNQANKLSTFVKDDAAVPKEMRSIAMGFHGRICPYDTPAGKKIGLVNTIAIGCRIEDGIMKAPYRRVIKTKDGKSKLTNRIDYLTVEEEQQFIIGDILSIRVDSEGYIDDAIINARVPSPVDVREKVKFELTDTRNLDYVNAFSNMHLSPAAALLTFASCNDVARDVFAINQNSQASYLQDSDVPIVYTSMYTHMFKYGNDFVIEAKANGYVVEVSNKVIVVQYEDSVEYQNIITDNFEVKVGDTVKADQPISLVPVIRAKYDGVIEDILDGNNILVRYDLPAHTEEIKFAETQLFNDALVMSNIRVKEGDSFKKGDILLDTATSRDGVYSPGSEELVAYVCKDGENYEDAISPIVNVTQKFISVSSKHVKRKVIEDKYRYTPDAVYGFKYISENSEITKIKKMANQSKLSTEEAWMSGNATGLLYRIDVEANEGYGKYASKEFVARMINYNRLEEADKLAGRHGNKGVTARITPMSKMLTFKNGVVSRIALNPLGVVSRMNTGQVLEAPLGFVGKLTGIRIISEPFNGASRTDIEILMSMLYDMANTYDIRNESELREVIKIYSTQGVPEDYIRDCVVMYDDIVEWKGCFEKDGTAEMYDPELGDYLPFRVVFGVSYILKIHQEVRDKIHTRAGMLSEPYVETTCQPPEGSSHKGGQKAGEMEILGVAGHGATNLVFEMTNTRSDNVGLRVEENIGILGIDPSAVDVPAEDKVPKAVNNLRYNLEAEGIKIESTFLPGIAQDNVERMKKYSAKEMVDYVESASDSSMNIYDEDSDLILDLIEIKVD